MTRQRSEGGDADLGDPVGAQRREHGSKGFEEVGVAGPSVAPGVVSYAAEGVVAGVVLASLVARRWWMEQVAVFGHE